MNLSVLVNLKQKQKTIQYLICILKCEQKQVRTSGKYFSGSPWISFSVPIERNSC